jgi:hypothetical protein
MWSTEKRLAYYRRLCTRCFNKCWVMPVPEYIPESQHDLYIMQKVAKEMGRKLNGTKQEV